MNLYNLKTGITVRMATPAERVASILASRCDGGVGAIEVDGEAHYVDGAGDDDAILLARYDLRLAYRQRGVTAAWRNLLAETHELRGT